MFGSILSCTDTIAILALLKEVGASKSLNSLIEGESLLNDGTCMILFEISSRIVKGEVRFFLFLFFCYFLKGNVIVGDYLDVFFTHYWRNFTWNNYWECCLVLD